MKATSEHDKKLAQLTFASCYPHYITKVERKGRTKAELLEVIQWLTGFKETDLNSFVKTGATFKDFFEKAKIPKEASQIKGSICGYKIQEITNPLTKKVRYLDKIIDELAKGKTLEKIKRK